MKSHNPLKLVVSTQFQHIFFDFFKKKKKKKGLFFNIEFFSHLYFLNRLFEIRPNPLAPCYRGRLCPRGQGAIFIYS